MTNTTLMAQNSLATTGTGVNIGTAVTSVNLQLTPQATNGYSGTVIIEGSAAPNPGSNDWFTIVTMDFTAHTSVLDFNLYFTNNPWIRARTPLNASLGAISVYMAS